MRITNLTERSEVYTSNAYLVRGDSNEIEDVNTLVDVGRDPGVIETIRATSTGVGKKPVEQVVLTHGHFDHVGVLSLVREAFDPVVYAFTPIDGVDQVLTDSQQLRFGDRWFEVLHTPGHSSDSVCFYCAEEAAIFAGDTPLLIASANGSYEEEFVQALERIAKKRIEIIYCGHGEPHTNNVAARLWASIDNVRRSDRVSRHEPSTGTDMGRSPHV